jgi:TetR/AcrR family transcriptional regulator, cholesterol catabolism regulator
MIGWTNRWFVPDRSPDSAESIGAAYAEMAVAGLRA